MSALRGPEGDGSHQSTAEDSMVRGLPQPKAKPPSSDSMTFTDTCLEKKRILIGKYINKQTKEEVKREGICPRSSSPATLAFPPTCTLPHPTYQR